MHLEGPQYRIPHHATKIAVAGVAGTGKSTLCRAISAHKTLPYTEIDSLFHGENWTKRESFEADVDAILARPHWVTEYQYGYAKPLIASQAHVIIWLDLPVHTAMKQLISRTWLRWWRKETLWNGNREPGPTTWVQRNDENMIWWGWSNRNALRDLDRQLAGSQATLIRLTSSREVQSWRARNGLIDS